MEIKIWEWCQTTICILAGGTICVLYALLKRLRDRLDKAEKDLRMYREHAASFDELLRQIRARQHEFHNHIQAIQSMHYTINTYDELVKEQKKYCGELQENNIFYHLLNSDWPVFSGFLYSKFAEADRKGIKITSSVRVKKRNENIPEYIIIEAAGILLDNAIEAALENGRRFLYVRIEGEENLSIEVMNPVIGVTYEDIGHFFEEGYSSKAGHDGLGLSKIKEYSRQYGMKKVISKVQYKNWEWILIRLEI